MGSKTYCLRCERCGSGCKCGNKDMVFIHTSKLRPPLTTKNRQRFRQFLDDCPQFANMVQEHQEEAFKQFLRKLKYYRPINGNVWISEEK